MSDNRPIVAGMVKGASRYTEFAPSTYTCDNCGSNQLYIPAWAEPSTFVPADIVTLECRDCKAAFNLTIIGVKIERIV